MQKQKLEPRGAFTFEKDNKTHLIFHPGNASILHHAHSSDTENFRVLKKEVTLSVGKRVFQKWPRSDHFLLSLCENTYYLAYLKNSLLFEPTLRLAVSKNGCDWKDLGKTPSEHPSVLVKDPEKRASPYILYSASGRKYITLALSKDLSTWEELGVVLGARTQRFDSSSISPLTARIYKRTILLIYTAKNGYGRTTLGAAVFQLDRPNTLLWRTEAPLWEEPYTWQKSTLRIIGGADQKKFFFIYVEKDGQIQTIPIVKYWERPYQKQIIADSTIQKYLPARKTPTRKIIKQKKTKRTNQPHLSDTQTELVLDRYAHNPILAPHQENTWETVATFNPAALHTGNKTHLIYRAIGENGASFFGYASSKDGFIIEERLPHPICFDPNVKSIKKKSQVYAPHLYPSGGSWGGYEDPRIVEIEGRVYMTFNLFENWTLRVGYVSIGTADFLAKRFHKWDGPHILSHGNRDKNWVLFPEKIQGQFAVLHSIIGNPENQVRIEYIDDLKKLSKRLFESPDPQKVPDKHIDWHIHVRSAGPPPVKTKDGWLLLYHANDHESHKYKVGAMLLDLEDPKKIIARAKSPVLSPDSHYENNGKPGIVYVSGAIIHNKELRVYYGGADKVVCVATAPIEPFLKALLAQKPFTLKKVVIKKSRAKK